MTLTSIKLSYSIKKLFKFYYSSDKWSIDNLDHKLIFLNNQVQFQIMDYEKLIVNDLQMSLSKEPLSQDIYSLKEDNGFFFCYIEENSKISLDIIQQSRRRIHLLNEAETILKFRRASTNSFSIAYKIQNTFGIFLYDILNETTLNIAETIGTMISFEISPNNKFIIYHYDGIFLKMFLLETPIPVDILTGNLPNSQILQSDFIVLFITKICFNFILGCFIDDSKRLYCFLSSDISIIVPKKEIISQCETSHLYLGEISSELGVTACGNMNLKIQFINNKLEYNGNIITLGNKDINYYVIASSEFSLYLGTTGTDRFYYLEKIEFPQCFAQKIIIHLNREFSFDKIYDDQTLVEILIAPSNGHLFDLETLAELNTKYPATNLIYHIN